MDSLVFLIKMHNMFTFSVFNFSLKTKSSVALSPLRAPSRSCWCSEYKQGSNEALVLTAPLFAWSVKSDSCYKVPTLQRALYEADALEQRRPCTRTSATTYIFFYSHSQKMVAV